jgi:amino acid transporter
MSVTERSAPQLLKVLTFWDLVVYGLVYVAPIGPWSTWGYADSFSGGVVALVYLLGAVALLFTAVSYGQMSLEVPETGSVYSYARVSMGDGAGFLAGWLVLLDYLLIPALMYVFCGVTLALFFPAIPRWGWILLVAAYNIGVNWFGVKTSARFNFATLILQFVLLFAVLSWAAYLLHAQGSPIFTMDPFWRTSTKISGVFAGASLCVMAYLGFDAITTLSGEVRPDHRHLIGRAVVFSLASLGALAVLNVCILSALGRGFHASDLASVTFELVSARINPAFGRFVTWASAFVVAVSITPPMVAAVARVLYAMAENGQMPRYLTKLHPKYGVPHLGILTSGAISIAVSLYFANQFDALTSMVNFGALSAFILVNVSVIALYMIRRKSNRWGVHLLVPILGIATILGVLTQMNTIGLAVGVTWLIVGAVAYWVQRTHAGRSGGEKKVSGSTNTRREQV